MERSRGSRLHAWGLHTTTGLTAWFNASLCIEEANATDCARKLSETESHRLFDRLLSQFGRTSASDAVVLWDHFVPASRSWSDIEHESIRTALASVALSESIYLLDASAGREQAYGYEVGRDIVHAVCHETYPGHDLYVTNHDVDWCIAITHEDCILFYEK